MQLLNKLYSIWLYDIKLLLSCSLYMFNIRSIYVSIKIMVVTSGDVNTFDPVAIIVMLSSSSLALSNLKKCFNIYQI